MEFNRSKWIESIYIPFYSILPIVGSLIPVLASPDTEILFQPLPISKIFGTLSLHEDVVQSGRKDGVEQRLTPSTTYENFSQNGILLPGTVGAPTHRLLGKRDGTEICRAVPIIHRISAFQLRIIHR